MNQERDKLRIQQTLAQFSVHDGINYEPVHLRSSRNGSSCYESSELCSEMPRFSANSQALLGHKDEVMVQESNRGVGESSFGNLSRTMSSCDPQCFSTWKNIGSQSSGDWMADPCPVFAGTLSSPLKMIHNGYLESNSSLINPLADVSTQNGQKPYGNLQCNSSFFQNQLHDVAPANSRITGLKMASFRQNNDEETSQGLWAVGGSELLLLPGYADQLRLKSGVEWYGGLEYGENKNIDRDHTTTANDNSNSQALSLSLSSVPSPKVRIEQTVERDISADLHSRNVSLSNIPNSEAMNSAYLSSSPKFSFDSKAAESFPQHTVGNSTFAHRYPGPLGPFTGYATILKSSKFLKPAQQLMDEHCNGASAKHFEMHEASPDKTLKEVVASGDSVCAFGPVLKAIPGDSDGSSFTFHGSNGTSQEPGGTSSKIDSHWSEYLQKKAKLLYMKDEVCRRYKQYHQQMQMVVSSFEPVSGLDAATPYISLGLKTVSRHFRFLKNAIADQLRSISNALGEDSSSPTAGTSSSKGDTSGSRLKFADKSFQKQKGGCYTGFLDPQQHVWRPQRGLPERAVSVLRAWLFDHFLHPYPTDTDKHMLAAQTGLTRNQVSNWFINARVRVWKPMVEEIHMLETKGMTETGLNASKTDGKSPTEGSAQLKGIQSINTRGINAASDKQMDCSRTSPSECQGDGLSAELWNQEKRSRVEYHIPDSMDGSFMGFVPYHQGGLEIGGLGAVSLTLGLRQSAESAQQMQPEHHLRQHIGGQIIHDFVG
ncbi:BEL1-like homeodomain protein 9 [Olea europaea var. sylvestris]|uniref:BEL1-like homeodomain protein 9 n=1 Tax=Olea europaea var. sylvestris TaxID=158386 RepID=UPI000C1D7896|nr:BEL1-like homeodomain protein 9 [Olea europaea var. sylvestris]